LKGVEVVTSLIHHTLDRLWTPFGQHRAARSVHSPPTATPRPGPYAVDTPIDGRATAMVRPYLLATYGMEAAR
jgi:hypothetical protein